MIRKSVPSRGQTPLYRQILRDAFISAWKNRILWPLALFAMVLQTGGIMDAVFYTVDSLGSQVHDDSRFVMLGQVWAVITSLFHATDTVSFLSAISSVQNLLFALIFLIAILGMSVISQGALIFGLGRVFRGEKPHLHESLQAGARVFQPVALLNIVSYAFMWAVTSLLLVPATSFITHPTILSIGAYALSLILFILVSIITTTVHLFALNAIVFERSSLTDAIGTGLTLLRRHWLIVLELSVFLFFIGLGLLIAGFIAFMLAGIPLFLFMAIFNLLNAESLFYITYLLAGFAFIVVMLCAGACDVTIQYGTWERLYQRTISGNPLAKTHRWLNWLFNHKAAR